MLKGNCRIKRFIHKYLFKTLIVFGLSIMAYASISLYNQTYSLDVIEFSNNDTILFNVERLTISNGRPTWERRSLSHLMKLRIL